MMHPPNQSPALSPRLVAWESTRACSLSCIHCRAAAQNTPHPDQLSTDEVKALIDDIAAMPPPLPPTSAPGVAASSPHPAHTSAAPGAAMPLIFIITGGDPLMRDDIFELASYADRKGLWVVMSPSGTAVDASVVAQMKEAGVRRISLSLDGSTPEIHDTFRNVPGSFDRLMTAVKHAREGGLSFQINTTVSQWNLEDLPALYNLVRELGAVTWDVFLLVPTGRGKVDLEITPQQYEDVLRYLADLDGKSAIEVKVTCAPHYVRIFSTAAAQRSGAHRGKSSGCMAGKGFAFVSHVGEIFGCGYLPVPAGSVREKPFSRIYRESPLFDELRNCDNLRGKCGACPWRYRCGGCRARALGVTGDYLAAEPFCLYEPPVAAPAVPSAPREAAEAPAPLLDERDRILLNIVQDDFPIDGEPFRILAERTGMAEEEIVARLESLKRAGVIRAIGGVVDAQRAGYRSVLVAMRVPPERLDEVAARVSAFEAVTHNYGRAHAYNLWFTVIAESDGRVGEVIEAVRRATGIDDVHSLPARKLFKIKVKFEL